MAKADILLSIVKAAIGNDSLSLKKAIEALVADERSKNHRILADRLSELLSTQSKQFNKITPIIQNGARDFGGGTLVQRLHCKCNMPGGIPLFKFKTPIIN
jgi:hypothetical protein